MLLNLGAALEKGTDKEETEYYGDGISETAA
jgi:hypothetical protein